VISKILIRVDFHSIKNGMLMDYPDTMKTALFILSVFFSVSAVAQPTVSGKTTPAKDTIIIFPTNSITLSGTAVQANPGHPVLDTTWTKTSGPAATITNPSNRMTTTVTGLVVGSYVFTLTATDKNNSSSTTVKVRVVSGILAMKLAYFNVSKNDQGTLFTWQTDMESNNARFVIQESTNGSNFYDIAVLSSKANGGNSSMPLTYSYQISNNNTQSDMHSIWLVMTLLAFIGLISKLKKAYKCLVLVIASVFFFSCTKSVTVPDNAPTSSKTTFRLKQVDMDNNVNYSEIIRLN
jgi:K319L-like, PKD domain